MLYSCTPMATVGVIKGLTCPLGRTIGCPRLDHLLHSAAAGTRMFDDFPFLKQAYTSRGKLTTGHGCMV